MDLDTLTLQKLFECTSAELESIPQDKLVKILAPYFLVTRPELAQKPDKTSRIRSMRETPEETEKRLKKEAAKKIALQYGLEL
jgi:hypothetical protein